jgi:ribose transport system permease protein
VKSAPEMQSPPTQERPDGVAERAAPNGRRRLLDVTKSPLFAVILGLAVLLIVFSIIDGPAFGSVTNFRNIALDVSLTLILGVGVTYVIISAGFDLSVGSVLVFSGVVSMKVMEQVGGGGWGTALVGLLASLLAGAAWGAVNGALVAYAKLNPIIVTLGSFGAALGLAQVIANGQDLVAVPTSMIELGSDRILGIPPIAFIALGFAAIAGIVLSKTAFGRYTHAIGSSKEAARRAGLRVERHLLAVYTFCGMAAGLAGWLALARFSTTSISGHSLDSLNAATAALLGGVSLYGGVGTILGTVFGAFIPGVLANGLVIADVQSYWQQVVTGGVLVLAVYIDRERRQRNE